MGEVHGLSLGMSQDNSSRSFKTTNDGIELVTNGAFTGAATGWTLASGWTYSANTVVKDGAGTGVLEQSIGAKADAVYLLTFTISSWTAGTTLTPSIGGVNGTAITGDGTYTQYITSTGVANLQFTPTTDVRCTIDTISVKRVDALITKNSAGTITGVIRGDQPSIQDNISVRVTRNSVQSLASTGTIVSWNTVDHEVGATTLWDVANPTRLTAPIAGTYLVVADIAAESDSIGQISILKNGTAVHNGTVPRFWTGSGSTSAPVRLSVGDYVECRVSPATTVNSIVAADRHYFAMVLVSL